jgi:hypothetical protein
LCTHNLFFFAVIPVFRFKSSFYSICFLFPFLDERYLIFINLLGAWVSYSDWDSLGGKVVRVMDKVPMNRVWSILTSCMSLGEGGVFLRFSWVFQKKFVF